MKKKLYQLLGLSLVATLIMSTATGCFGLKKEKDEDSDIEISEEIEAFDSDDEEELETEEGIVVTTAEEFVEAIAPETEIIVDASYMNLTEYIEEIWEQDREGFNAEHEYVQIEECEDGAQLVIQDVEGLMITGATDQYADTEIVVEPRYADCLKFVNCNNINLSNMTIGHTQQGDCMGDVLNFISCHEVYLDTMDLYGCGVYGISAKEGSGDFMITYTVLRDCSYGAFNISEAEGGFIFSDCTLTGSLGIPYYDDGENSWVEFYSCTFGQKETEGVMFSDTMYADEACVFSEDIENYPDYEYDPEYDPEYDEDFENEYEGDEGFMDLSPENFNLVFPQEYGLEGTYWDANFRQNATTGKLAFFTGEENDYVVIDFFDDGTGTIDMYGTEEEFTWKYVENHSVELKFSNKTWKADFFEEVENEGFVWMQIRVDNEILWFM